MNRVHANHLIIDSKRESEVLKKSKKLTAKPQIGHQSKDLIGVHYMHTVWNYILWHPAFDRKRRGGVKFRQMVKVVDGTKGSKSTVLGN